MIKKVYTDEISMDEWKQKLATDDNDWLIRQYYGLKFLVRMMDSQIETIYHDMNIKNSVEDDYKTVILPLEDEMMDFDCQLANVEDEMDLRGLDALIVE
jgi:hypothetical protein